LKTSKEDEDQNTSKGDEEAKSSHRRLSFGGRTLAHFIEILEEEIERSKFSVENSRSCEGRKIQRSCRVDKGWTNLLCWCQGSTRTINHGQFGLSDHFVNSKFVSLEVEDQTLGVTKFQVARRGGRDPNRWIQDAGETSDLNLHGVSHIVNSEERPNPLVMRSLE
jgi:hypothetical protein